MHCDSAFAVRFSLSVIFLATIWPLIEILQSLVKVSLGCGVFSYYAMFFLFFWYHCKLHYVYASAFDMCNNEVYLITLLTYLRYLNR